MLEILQAHLNAFSFQIVIATVLIAGLVRGFSGFGTGMVIVPVVSSLYSLQTAMVIIFIIDGLPVLPAVVPEFKRIKWREFLPIIIGATLCLPIGILILKYGDPIILRWFVASIIMITITVLWSGWIYKGPRGNIPSGIVGAIGGIIGATSGLPGPPVIMYWMASKLSSVIVRANTMVYLFLMDILIGFNLYIAGLITLDGMIKGAIVAPIYLAGLLIGKKLFGFASEKTYRNFAFFIILISAITSLPILDAYLRG